MFRVLYLALAILVALAGFAFHVRNNQPITLDYVSGTMVLELSWVMVATLLVGVLLGVLGMSASLLGARREARRLARRNAQAQRELDSLRAVALKDAG